MTKFTNLQATVINIFNPFLATFKKDFGVNASAPAEIYKNDPKFGLSELDGFLCSGFGPNPMQGIQVLGPGSAQPRGNVLG